MFKFGNWDGAIAASNNKNGKSPRTSVAPDDFKKNAAGESLLTLAGGATKNGLTSPQRCITTLSASRGRQV